MTDSILEHTGIMGMHWGHRKSSGWAPHDNTAAKQHVATTGKKIAKPFVKPDKKTTALGPRLTDAQLKARINRLQMEKSYAQLTKKEMSPGKKAVMNMLTSTAKQTASVYLAKYMNKTIESLIGTKIPTPPVPVP